MEKRVKGDHGKKKKKKDGLVKNSVHFNISKAISFLSKQI
jgi:hypothetical protein